MSLYVIMESNGSKISIDKNMSLLINNALDMGYKKIDMIKADSYDHALEILKLEENSHNVHVTEYKDVVHKVNGKVVGVKDISRVCGYINETFSVTYTNAPDISGFLLGKQFENRNKRKDMRVNEATSHLQKLAVKLDGNAVVETSIDVELGGAFEKDRITIRGLVVRVK